MCGIYKGSKPQWTTRSVLDTGWKPLDIQSNKKHKDLFEYSLAIIQTGPPETLVAIGTIPDPHTKSLQGGVEVYRGNFVPNNKYFFEFVVW